MKLAVLIPCYNCERHLNECLDSVFAAAKDYAERDGERRVDIMCGIDGPTDGTEKALDDYCAMHGATAVDGRVVLRTFNHPNMGVSATRNDLLDRVAPDVDAVCFVDSDDTVLPCLLSVQASALEQTGVDIVESGIAPERSYLYQGDGADLRPIVVTDLFMDGWINVVNKLYGRSVIGDIRFRKGLYFEEDNFFNREVNRVAKRKARVNARMYYYRDNPASATGRLDFAKYVSSVIERVRLTLEIFGPSAELAKDTYRMLIRKNLKKNEIASERRRYFAEASRALVRYEGEYGFVPTGLNPIQRLIWSACRNERYWLAKGLVYLT